MTMLSPWFVGMDDTRRSRSRPMTLIWMRPSWGTRFSAMLMLAMIFTRLMMADCRRFGGLSTSCSTPSMR